MEPKITSTASTKNESRKRPFDSSREGYTLDDVYGEDTDVSSVWNQPPFRWSEEMELEDALKSAFSNLKPFVQKTTVDIQEDDPEIVLPRGFDVCFPQASHIVASLAKTLKIRITIDDQIVLNHDNCLALPFSKMDGNGFLAHLRRDPTNNLTRGWQSLCNALLALESIEIKTILQNRDVGHGFVYYLYGRAFQKIYYGVSPEKVKQLFYYSETTETEFLNRIRELAPNVATFPSYVRSLFYKLTYFLILRYHEKHRILGEHDKLFEFTKCLYVNNSAAVERLYKRAPAQKLKQAFKIKSKNKKILPKESDYETYMKTHKPYINPAKTVISAEDLEVVKKVNVSLQLLGPHIREEPVIYNQDVRKNVLTSFIDNFHAKAALFSQRLESRKRQIHATLIKKRAQNPVFAQKTEQERKIVPFSTDEWKEEIQDYLLKNKGEVARWCFEIFKASLSDGWSVKRRAIQEYDTLRRQAKRELGFSKSSFEEEFPPLTKKSVDYDMEESEDPSNQIIDVE